MLHPRNKTFACLREYKLDTYVICLKNKYLVESRGRTMLDIGSFISFFPNLLFFYLYKLKVESHFPFLSSNNSNKILFFGLHKPSRPVLFTSHVDSTPHKKFILLLFQLQNFSFKSKLKYLISDSKLHLIWVSLASLDQIKE